MGKLHIIVLLYSFSFSLLGFNNEVENNAETYKDLLIKIEIKIPRGLFIKMIEDLEYNSGLSKMELQQKRNAKSLLWNGS